MTLPRSHILSSQQQGQVLNHYFAFRSGRYFVYLGPIGLDLLFSKSCDLAKDSSTSEKQAMRSRGRARWKLRRRPRSRIISNSVCWKSPYLVNRWCCWQSGAKIFGFPSEENLTTKHMAKDPLTSTRYFALIDGTNQRNDGQDQQSIPDRKAWVVRGGPSRLIINDRRAYLAKIVVRGCQGLKSHFAFQS